MKIGTSLTHTKTPTTCTASRVSRRGFTIVELLIVVVVIAILAALALVAYNGITSRTKASAAQTSAKQAYTKLQTYAVANAEQYPSDLASAGVASTGSASYQYRYDNSSNPTSFCLTATTQGVSYFVSNTTSAPTAGACAGHGANGAAVITNLVANPSLETNAVGYSAVNGASVNRENASAILGTFGLTVVTATGGAIDSGAVIPFPSPVTAGQPVTYGVSIRAVTGGTYRLSFQGTGGGMASQPITLAANQVGRIVYTHTPATSGPLAAYVLRTTSASSTFHIDGLMAVQGDATAAYADGDSPGWAWTGTANSSQSTGPAL